MNAGRSKEYQEETSTLPYPIPRFSRGKLDNRKAPTYVERFGGQREVVEREQGVAQWMGFKPAHTVNPNFQWVDTAERSNPPGIHIGEPFYAMEAHRTSVQGG